MANMAMAPKIAKLAPLYRPAVREVTAAFALALVGLLAWCSSERAFLLLAKEGSLFEGLTVVFFGWASFAFLSAARSTRGARARALACLALALVGAFVAMEEINWGQRLLGFAARDAAFSVHNTDFSRTALGLPVDEHSFDRAALAGSALLFCALGPLWRWRRPRASLAPPPSTTLVMLLGVAFMSRRYLEVLPWQDALVVVALAGGLFAYSTSPPAAPLRGALLVALALCLVTWALFLVVDHGSRNRPNEVRECFIALAFAAWGDAVRRRAQGAEP